VLLHRTAHLILPLTLVLKVTPITALGMVVRQRVPVDRRE